MVRICESSGQRFFSVASQDPVERRGGRHTSEMPATAPEDFVSACRPFYREALSSQQRDVPAMKDTEKGIGMLSVDFDIVAVGDRWKMRLEEEEGVKVDEERRLSREALCSLCRVSR